MLDNVKPNKACLFHLIFKDSLVLFCRLVLCGFFVVVVVVVVLVVLVVLVVAVVLDPSKYIFNHNYIHVYF